MGRLLLLVFYLSLLKFEEHLYRIFWFENVFESFVNTIPWLSINLNLFANNNLIYYQAG